MAQPWTALRDLGRHTGLNATQRLLSGSMWERVHVFRSYQTKMVHGLLQTRSHMTAILLTVRAERSVVVDDAAAAVAERISDRATRSVAWPSSVHSASTSGAAVGEPKFAPLASRPDAHRQPGRSRDLWRLAE